MIVAIHVIWPEEFRWIGLNRFDSAWTGIKTAVIRSNTICHNEKNGFGFSKWVAVRFKDYFKSEDYRFEILLELLFSEDHKLVWKSAYLKIKPNLTIWNKVIVSSMVRHTHYETRLLTQNKNPRTWSDVRNETFSPIPIPYSICTNKQILYMQFV